MTVEIALEEHWYAIRIQSGKESDAVKLIKDSEKLCRLCDVDHSSFIDFFVPKQEIVSYKDKGKVVNERVLYPGYIFVKMILTDKVRLFIKNKLGILSEPKLVSDLEYQRMLVSMEEMQSKSTLSFAIGEKVKIISGIFASMQGTVDEINEQHAKLSVVVPLFGRDAKTEISFDEVSKITDDN